MPTQRAVTFAASSTCALPAAQAGDVLVAFIHREAGPAFSGGAGWTTVTTTTSGDSAPGLRVAWKVWQSGDATPTWTNATAISIASHSGCNLSNPIGAFTATGATGQFGTGTAVGLLGLTLQVTDGTSSILSGWSHRMSSSLSTPSGMTQDVDAGHSTGGLSRFAYARLDSASSFAARSSTATTSAGWRAVSVELLAAPVTARTAVFTAASSLTASGVLTGIRTTTPSAASGLDASGTQIGIRTTTPAAASAFTAAGTQVGIRTTTPTAASGLDAHATPIDVRGVTLTAAASLAAAATLIGTRGATLTADSALVAPATLTETRALSLSASSSLAATAVLVGARTVALAAGAGLTASAVQIGIRNAILETTAALTAPVVQVGTRTLVVGADSAFTATAAQIDVRTLTLTAAGTLTAYAVAGIDPNAAKPVQRPKLVLTTPTARLVLTDVDAKLVLTTPRARLKFGAPPLITPPQSDPLQEFMDTRKGPAAAIFGNTWSQMVANRVVVTTSEDNASDSSPTAGSLRKAGQGTGPRIIEFAPDVTGDIVPANRWPIPITSDALINGAGYSGTVRTGLNPKNTTQTGAMYLSLREPWAYGNSPSDRMLWNYSNVGLGRLWRCTLWDGGDALIASGAYNPQTVPAPYGWTTEECLLGPTPGRYAYGAPIRSGSQGTDRGPHDPANSFVRFDRVTKDGRAWHAAGPIPAGTAWDPGYWATLGVVNALDNEARNGKIVNNAIPHNYLDAHPEELELYRRACTGALINCVLQGGIIRSPKANDQVLDVIGCLIAKYGHPYRVVNGGAAGVASGLAGEDGAWINADGNVWIPKIAGEQMFAMPHALADQLGYPRMTVNADGAGATAIDWGGDKTLGSLYVSPNNWLPGGALVASALLSGVIQSGIGSPLGWDRTAARVINGTTVPGYSLAVPDVSTYAAAAAHVAWLMGTVGNPHATEQPPLWSDTHIGGPGNFPRP